MTTRELIQAHKKCIEVLEAIQTFDRKIVDAKYWSELYKLQFYAIKKQYQHLIEIYQMCITRLQERYNKINNQIK